MQKNAAYERMSYMKKLLLATLCLLLTGTFINSSAPRIHAAETTAESNADVPVSYTHLDVYKRQAVHGIGAGILSLAEALGKWLWDGFCNGVRDFVSDPIGFLRSVIVDPIINGIKELFGIHSPSTVFSDIGGFLIEGLINGIKAGVGALVGLIPSIFGGIASAIGDVWDGIKSAAGTAWEGIKTHVGNTWDQIKEGRCV